jgi:two-component system sensor histidine kinase BarA
MSVDSPQNSNRLALAEVARLEDVVDRDALAEVCRSFHGLFGLSIRVYSREGALLADVHSEQALCQYVNTLGHGRTACSRTVGEVKRIDPTDGPVLHPCFTGAVYRVVPIDYHGRRVGRFVVGPYLPAEVKEVPRSLLVIDPGIDAERARTDLAGLPRVRAETADRIATHLRGILDLLLFSSHKAYLTSEMHIASVRESFRELAEKNARLESAYEKLKELDRLKSNFLATVSHELRTPLTSIIGYSEMLESGIAGEIVGEQLEFIQIIREKGEHLLQLITSLLDLGKLEQGSIRLERSPVDVTWLLDDVQKTFVPRAQKRGVKMEIAVAPGLRKMSGDVVRLRQVMFNLVENAVKFSPDNGIITLSARSVELLDESDSAGAVLMAETIPAVEIRIRDAGAGMPKEELPKIFDAFYQVDSSSTRQHGGAGLGLSIVKRIVEAHGGTISVDSAPGDGTVFTVVIPEPEAA